MGKLTYIVPKKLPRRLRKGDRVVVRDREMMVLGNTRIITVFRDIATTECGRTWRASDGWWVGEVGDCHPFPSVRQMTAKEIRSADRAAEGGRAMKRKRLVYGR